MHGGQIEEALAKRQRTLREGFESGASKQGGGELAEASATNHGGGEGDEPATPEHGGGQRVASRAAQHDGDMENGGQPATRPTALFLHDSDEDKALLDWLRERPELPRCATLLQQIMEWTGKAHLTQMRSLAKEQKVTIQRQAQSNTQLFREAVRRHFKAAVAQERGRRTCFQFNVRRGASEHPGPLASKAEHDLNAADVVDLRSLSLFRRQKQAEMPEHLRNAIGRLTGGYK